MKNVSIISELHIHRTRLETIKTINGLLEELWLDMPKEEQKLDDCKAFLASTEDKVFNTLAKVERGIVRDLKRAQKAKKKVVDTKSLYAGIETYELLNYRIGGDNSKELTQELERRAKVAAKARKGKVSGTQVAAQSNGKREKVVY